MAHLEEISRELEKRGKADAIKRLADSPEGKKLSGMVDAAALERAANSGDSSAMQAIVQRVLSTAEGKKLAADVKRLMEK